MIVRILTAHVPRENVGPFNDLLLAQLTELREQPGLVYVKLARRLNESQGEEVVLVEEWRTPADLLAWTKGRLTKPRLLPGTEDLLKDLAISHYEAIDLSAADLAARVLGEADPDGLSGGDGSPMPVRHAPEPAFEPVVAPKIA